MKLANLFLITALVGLLGAIGCTTDSGNGGNGGTGGTGGGAADPCTGGACDADETRKDACVLGIDCCNTRCFTDGAGGAGGAGGAPTEAQCDAFGNVICNIDTGAGGAGGAGGNPGGCDWNADQVCTVENCDVDDAIQACKDRFGECLAADLGGNECEKCVTVALEKCGGF